MSWSSPTNTPSTALLPPPRAKNNPQRFKRLLKFIRCHRASFKKSYRVCFERAWLHRERVKKAGVESSGLLHFSIRKQRLFLGAAGYSTGEGAVPAGLGGSSRPPAHTEGPELDSLTCRLRPAPGAATRAQAIGPVATRTAPKLQRRADRESAIVPTPKCGVTALHLFPQPWAWMRSTGSECTLGDAAGMSPSALGAALVLPPVTSKHSPLLGL